MLKRTKKIIFLCGGIVIFVIVICLLAFSSKKTENGSKVQHQEKSPNKPIVPSTEPLDNVPAEREDINSQLTLEERKESKKLTSAEEKTIIKSLATQVNIDKEKSYFDYKWGFGMVPGNWEIFDDQDQALYLFTDKGKFFVKINNYSDLSRFEYEKESMLVINEAVSDFAPRPLCLGNLPNGGKFLVVNFIEARWRDRLLVENQKKLAKTLSQLHQKKSPNSKFGFHAGKNNQWKDNWATFFLENRWQPLWERFLQKYPHETEMIKWGEIISTQVIPDLLGNLQIEPVLIHGNLDFDSWDISSQTNQPWVFDTHSYYGHNEMDLSLMHYYWPPGKIPGVKGPEGEFFETEFIAEYQKHNPLPPGFEKRKLLYQLYHYLHRNIVISDPNRKWKKKSLNNDEKIGFKNQNNLANQEI
ncbi:fructosamine kinase family protein [endosymbiont GvMRE of Glomus versiforme]|uniref:fructosamine kinase family protein n=1 Tax=endosymbiont GvMRE of Glomus versiforme TaxID=2039283 RepID=UPI000EEED21A|nr:fructosamine kinase family protein [endosymbiont GvMRE of Glomus versiforme]RHZ36310.1 Fructosamine kinase [endosymbiont GvMRE of Glomus versiforme]